MVERIPPHNEEAERSVLGAAMLSKDARYDVIEEVKDYRPSFQSQEYKYNRGDDSMHSLNAKPLKGGNLYSEGTSKKGKIKKAQTEPNTASEALTFKSKTVKTLSPERISELKENLTEPNALSGTTNSAFMRSICFSLLAIVI